MGVWSLHHDISREKFLAAIGVRHVFLGELQYLGRIAITPVKLEMYEGTTDWAEYQFYFNQLAELIGWDEERHAMMLGICLKGEARVVFASLEKAQWIYHAFTKALTQSFAPKELVHIYQGMEEESS